MKQLKPYLFVLVIFLIPFLLIPLLKIGNSSSQFATSDVKSNTEKFVPGIVIHGGAGAIKKGTLTADEELAYQLKLTEALELGISKIKQGDSALNVVVEVIKILEDSPLFNAGKGAVLTHEGEVALDASIMDGKTLNAGAVAGVTTVKNPITAAYKVLEKSNHVLLSGSGADLFAAEQGLDLVDPSYFITPKQIENLKKVQQRDKKQIEKLGTVGCVVLDNHGNLAAGTSTGGMVNKKYGRIGDSPIIGAGTYANNGTCAVSATGHGEYFIRYAVAHDISTRIKYLGETLGQASDTVINQLKVAGGMGGVIGIDKMGNICMPFNTEGMFRGYCSHGKTPEVYLYSLSK